MGRANGLEITKSGQVSDVGAQLELPWYRSTSDFRHKDDVRSYSITCDPTCMLCWDAFALPTRLVLHDQSASCMSRIGVAEREEPLDAPPQKKARSTGTEQPGEVVDVKLEVETGGQCDMSVREVRVDPVVARTHIRHILSHIWGVIDVSAWPDGHHGQVVSEYICTRSNFACDVVLKVTRPTAALLSPLALCALASPVGCPGGGHGSTHARLHTSIRKIKLHHARNRLAPHAHPLRTNEHPPIQMFVRCQGQPRVTTSVLRLTV